MFSFLKIKERERERNKLEEDFKNSRKLRDITNLKSHRIQKKKKKSTLDRSLETESASLLFTYFPNKIHPNPSINDPICMEFQQTSLSLKSKLNISLEGRVRFYSIGEKFRSKMAFFFVVFLLLRSIEWFKNRGIKGKKVDPLPWIVWKMQNLPFKGELVERKGFCV